MTKVCLVILDGFGINENDEGRDSTKEAHYLKKLYLTEVSFRLYASCEFVGLYKDQMGNSEIGHLTISAGRIINTDFKRINESIINGSFKNILLNKLSSTQNKIHLITMVSDGGIHSHINHLKFVNSTLRNMGRETYIHAIADGRDTKERAFTKFYKQFSNIISISGRYYTMDRDNNVERTNCAYDMMTNGEVKDFDISTLYKNGITDEFIPPILIKDNKIKKEDTIIFLNYRADRMRQIFDRFKNFPYVFTMTEYNENCKNCCFFPKQNINMNLGEVISRSGLVQSRIAETEKYAHVTYFFNGRREQAYKNENRHLIKSAKVDTFDLRPTMMSDEITNKCIERMDRDDGLIVVNYASPDMVGHTGNFEATKAAISNIDKNIEKMHFKAIEKDYILVITSDHGNAEDMGTDTEINKKHTGNKVPLIIVNSEGHVGIKSTGIISDVAPTILFLLDIKKPKEMDGISLVKKAFI